MVLASQNQKTLFLQEILFSWRSKTLKPSKDINNPDNLMTFNREHHVDDLALYGFLLTSAFSTMALILAISIMMASVSLFIITMTIKSIPISMHQFVMVQSLSV